MNKSVTKQINSEVSRQTFGRLISPRTRKFLFALLLSAILLQIQSKVEAQANLINLYDWSNNTQVGYDTNPNDYVNLSSFNSASFYGDLSPNGFAVPILSGTLSTIPGAAYEISFTLENQNNEACSGYEYFGNTSTDIDMPPAGGSPFSPTFAPINVDFTVIANSTSTDMSFEFALDNSGVASLSDLTVQEVPEMSTSEMFALGLVLVFAWKSRRLLQTPARKLAVAR